MSIRKILSFALALAAVCLMMTACMNDEGTTVRNNPPVPAVTSGVAPNMNSGSNSTVTENGTAGTNSSDVGQNNGGTASNGNTSATTSNGALGAFDWANGAADIEKAIGQISELSDARVVVTNSTALVGVRFDNAYKGELTERIREMVAAEVLKADPSIQTVAVTSNTEDVGKVYDLADQVRAGRTADELSSEINAIVRNATTLR